MCRCENVGANYHSPQSQHKLPDVKIDMQKKIEGFFEQQLNEWDLAKKNYAGLQKVHKRYVQLDDLVRVGIQFNPERIYSSAAKVDDKSIRERKCFLCRENLPAQQRWLAFGDEYLVLVNPFPIFPRHLTIPVIQHTDQRIAGRMGDMLDLARELNEFVVFYNGPKCGASAPDHFHFQAGNKGFMPLEKDFEKFPKTVIDTINGVEVLQLDNYYRTCLVLQGVDRQMLVASFEGLMDRLPVSPNDDEPMLNILTSHDAGKWRIFIFPRKLHRPSQYFKEGEGRILLSPASVDLGGVLITPREEDYHKIDADIIKDIFKQVCLGKLKEDE